MEPRQLVQAWVDAFNRADAAVMALAHAHRPSLAADTQPKLLPPPEGPRRLTVVAEKPLRIPNLRTDRLGTFEFISWWECEKVQASRMLVVGSGALGNEVVKSLALMGIGHLFIVDFDTNEAANLSRSVFFREAVTPAKTRRLSLPRAPRPSTRRCGCSTCKAMSRPASDWGSSAGWS